MNPTSEKADRSRPVEQLRRSFFRELTACFLAVICCIHSTTFRVTTTMQWATSRSQPTLVDRSTTKIGQKRRVGSLQTAVATSFRVRYSKQIYLRLDHEKTFPTTSYLWRSVEKYYPGQKKLRQARKPNIGTCMLDRSRHMRVVVSMFLARVVVTQWLSKLYWSPAIDFWLGRP